MKHIESRRGLEKLLKKYKEAGASEYWITVIQQCIDEGLAMDEVDYENTPSELKPLWKGLK